jgi:hypothetical protein
MQMLQNVECYTCGKTGHFASVCRSKSTNHQPKRFNKGKNRKTYSLQEKAETESESDDSDELAYTIGNTTQVTILINNVATSMIVDSGATCNVINTATAEKTGHSEQVQQAAAPLWLSADHRKARDPCSDISVQTQGKTYRSQIPCH